MLRHEDDSDAIDGALHRVAEYGTAQARMADRASIRALGAARRRRRLAVSGPSGATMAVVLAALAVGPLLVGGAANSHAGTAHDGGGIAYRAIVGGGDGAPNSVAPSQYTLMLIDEGPTCASVPLSTPSPAATAGLLQLPPLSPPARAAVGDAAGKSHCIVRLDTATGAMTLDSTSSYEGAWETCVTWPKPSSGYAPVPQASERCPRFITSIGAGRTNIGWLLISGGHARFQSVQPAATPTEPTH